MANADPKKDAKKRRTTGKTRFTRVYNRVHNLLNAPIINIEDINGTFPDLSRSFTDLEEYSERYVVLLESDDEDDSKEIQRINEDMEYLYENFCVVRTKFSKLGQELPEVENPKNPLVQDRGIKVKPLEAPTFNGDIRKYPSFKRDYTTHMVASYGRDAFALKSCLRDEALKVVQGVDNDYDEMMKRLDIRYGKPAKIVDSVLHDLKRLKPINDGEMFKLINLVDTVERCWLDLKQMDLQREMNTTTMLSQVEKLLPPTQRREWALIVHKEEEFGKELEFELFLEYLLKEKHVMEYLQQSVRHLETRKEVHFLSKDDTGKESAYEDGGVLSALQKQIDENQFTLKRVADGLALVSQAVFAGNTRRSSDPPPKKKCWYHGVDSHSIYECANFKQLDIQTKFSEARKKGVCYCCLKVGHLARDCNDKKPCILSNGKDETCGRNHHSLLHTDNAVNGTSNHNIDLNQKEVMLMVSEVRCHNLPISTLWDPGANISLITHESAKALGLKGEPVNLNITKVGNESEQVTTKKYIIPLVDLTGKTWNVEAYGIDEITSEAESVDTKRIAGIFSDVTAAELKRPAGKIDLLIGTNYCSLLPIVVQQVGNLQLMKSQFGYCLRGYLNSDKPKVDNARVHFMLGSTFATTNTLIKRGSKLEDEIKNFMNIDELGVQVHPKCGRCGCGKCAVGSGPYTIQEEREMHLIESGLHYDKEEKTFTVIYPWVRDPRNLPNNYKAVLGRLRSTQKRLLKQGQEYINKYDDEIKDMVRRQAARILDEKEVSGYEGSVHYIPHHEILKPGSSSTPLRVVFDSSSSYMGHSLNNYWAKGPCILNDLLGVLLRFREKAIGLVADISKMYNSIRLSELDQHTHRFLWGPEPKHYVLSRVPFGDKPSGTIAILALKKTAELCERKYPKEAEILKRNTYVDDILASTDGLVEAKHTTECIDTILKEGGFKVKNWVMSGITRKEETLDEQNPDKLPLVDSTDERVLGMIWDPEKDIFSFKAKLNFSPVRRGIAIQDDLKYEDIEQCVPTRLTRRIVLSQISKVFDPMGLIAPFTLEAKVLMRHIFIENEQKGWDVPITEENRWIWITFFKKLFQIESLRFTRSLRPKSSFVNPILVIFSDASESAYGTCAYVRWQVDDNEFKSFLIAAKNRLSPTRVLSIPRLELCAAVLGCRLRKKITDEMNIQFLKTMHITDSSIVYHQVQKESYGFATFVAVRVGEIQNISEPIEWWWTPSKENPADMVTRITSIENMNSDSVWQNGPKYMELPTKEWPTTKEITQDVNELPDKVKVVLSLSNSEVEQTEVSLEDINIKRFRNLHKLHDVTAFIILIARRRTFFRTRSKISPTTLAEAEEIWIKYVQRELRNDYLKRFQNLGPMLTPEGIIVVGRRMASWLRNNWNKKLLTLLPYNHSYTNLVLLTAHDEEHEAVDTTLEKVRRTYWIPKARKTLGGIQRNCVECRRRNKKAVGQQMGELPQKRLLPAPPFYSAAVDLFGPFAIRGTVNKRSRGKAYGVLFNCLVSRAVYIDVATGYDTDSFLMVLRRYVSVRGFSRNMLSDAGSQLVAASKELEDIWRKWDWEKITSFGRTEGMEWQLTKSADAPWENGCSEALIRLTKRNIVASVGTNILSFPELQTVMFEVANLLNERPIGTKTNDPNEGSCCCPNDLLLGRASIRVPPGKWDINANTRKRWEFVQMVVNTFWKKWMQDYFHTLIVRKKWHTEQRNLKIGDIVMVPDTKSIRGNWKLAEVMEAVPGRDDRVRDVLIRYKVQSPTLHYKGVIDTVIRRSAHRLVVILPIEEQETS